jgi:hypothetical protein
LVSKYLLPNVKDSEIHNDYWGSDHCPISITMDADSINLNEFSEYMALGGGVEDYKSLLRDNKLNCLRGDSNNREGIGSSKGGLDEERKSDLEDFNENEERDMVMGGMDEFDKMDEFTDKCNNI